MKHTRKIWMVGTISLFTLYARAQSDRNIPTAMAFLLTRPDARSSAMGDAGAATQADPYAIYANPSKIAFGQHQIEAGLSYVPLMRNLVKDVSLINFSGYRRSNARNVLGMSVYYLSYGKVELTDNNGQFIQNYTPVEYTLDFTYARKMTNHFSMGLTGRFLHSDIHSGVSNSGLLLDPANAFAADISLYYEKSKMRGPEGTGWAFGAVLSNLGTKIQYSDDKNNFLPTSLKIGGAYSFLTSNKSQKLTLALDLNKLMVPTPPEYDGNGQIVDGKDPNRSVVSALFTSFSDAPGGFSEEIKEISIGTGIEYLFNEAFALRMGYFHESEEKGNREHLTIGSGLKYRNYQFDLGYIIPTSNRYVLRNNIKFSLGLNFK
ncbi:MAG: type IX secretion system outer membrane channel protein PorV [Sphingobacteriaceae bacterium]